MALFTGNDTGEQNGDNYSRAAVARSIWGINAATGIAANNAAVNFPVPSAEWDDSTWAGIMSASAGGDTLLTMAYAIILQLHKQSQCWLGDECFDYWPRFSVGRTHY